MLQRQQAERLIAAGADLVVGNHTHVVQAIDEINGIPVFFGWGILSSTRICASSARGDLLVKFQGTNTWATS